MSNIDINNLREVSTSQTRSQSYDLKYSSSQKRFSFSKSFYENNDMANYGLKLYKTNVDGNIVLVLGKVPNDEASFYRGREGKEKGQIFFNNALADSVVALTELDNEEAFTISMKLTPVENNNDLELFEVVINAIDVKQTETLTA